MKKYFFSSFAVICTLGIQHASAVTTIAFDVANIATHGTLQELGASTVLQSSGGLELNSNAVESSDWEGDGGIYMQGTPVRILLGSGGTGLNSASNGKFEIWSFQSTSGSTPFFSLDTSGKTSAFAGVNVSINKLGTDGGNLNVAGNLSVTGTMTGPGGSGVVTQASIPAILKSQSKLEIGSTATAGLATSVAFGTSVVASNTNTFAGGNLSSATGKTAMAYGENAIAGGDYAVALGGGARATGGYSVAVGQNAQALGGGSAAIGCGNVAYGGGSFAAGIATNANAFGSVSLGLFSIDNQSANRLEADHPEDPVFTVGNGTDWGAAYRSNAIQTLKSGKTTLTNKFWQSSQPLNTITTPNAASGEALVVEGNTRLRGKVIIEKAQGDIAMGAYGTP